MATDLYQGWDHRWLGTATVTVTDAVGSAAVSITSGKYAHLSLASVDPEDRSGTTIDTGYSDFATALATAINAAMSDTITVTWSSSALTYTIANSSSSTLQLAFSGAAGDRMRRILGLTANKATDPTTSDMRPWYVMRAEVDGRAKYDQPAAKGGQIRSAMGDDGTLYSLAPTRLIREARWEHEFEAKASIHRRFAVADTLAAGASYTWEDFMDHAARFAVPCVIKDSTESMVFYTSQAFERATFRRRGAQADPQQTVGIRADSIVGYL